MPKSQKSIFLRVNRGIGAKVRARRIELAMTLSDCAALLGVTFQQLHKYETGLNGMRAAALPTLAKILNVPISYFFDGAEHPIAADDGPHSTLRLRTIKAVNKSRQPRRAAHH